VGVASTNVITARVEAEETWREIFPSLEEGTANLRVSPGEANRDEAVSLAGAGVVADSNSTVLTQTLLVEQLDREMDRREERKGLDMAAFTLLSVAGEDPWTQPADAR
jgi:hypothetical protein